MSDSLGNRKALPSELSGPARRALLQLRAFAVADLNQGGVWRVLPYYRHFGELSADEMLAIVDAFPPGEDPERTVKRASDETADTGTHWIDTGSSSGYETTL